MNHLSKKETISTQAIYYQWSSPFTWQLTGLLLRVSLPGLPEGHQGPEVGSEHRPAEGGRRVDAHQAADEGVLAALQQGDDVRTHVVRVLLPEVLRGRFQKKRHEDFNGASRHRHIDRRPEKT